eukprot:gene39160-biopygen2770
MESRWLLETARVFEEVVDRGGKEVSSRRLKQSVPADPASHRTSYYALEVSGAGLYGSCESWNQYLLHSLPVTYDAKVLNSVQLITETGQVQSAVKSITCSDPAISTQLVEALVSPFHGDNPALRVNVSLFCDAQQWVVQDCYPQQGAGAAYTVQYS